MKTPANVGVDHIGLEIGQKNARHPQYIYNNNSEQSS